MTEDLAHRDLIVAQNNLSACLAKIDKMYEEIEMARKDIAAKQKLGTLEALASICASERFIEGEKIRIQRERHRARELMMIVEVEQEKLIVAMQERKKMDKLKERQKEQYREELKKYEMRKMDDLVVMRVKKERAS